MATNPSWREIRVSIIFRAFDALYTKAVVEPLVSPRTRRTDLLKENISKLRWTKKYSTAKRAEVGAVGIVSSTRATRFRSSFAYTSIGSLIFFETVPK